MKFDDLNFNDRGGIMGRQAVVFFPNGYGASVINGGLFKGYELAVLKGSEGKSAPCYDTPITNDVEAGLLPDDVGRLLSEIAALPVVEG